MIASQVLAELFQGQTSLLEDSEKGTPLQVFGVPGNGEWPWESWPIQDSVLACVSDDGETCPLESGGDR